MVDWEFEDFNTHGNVWYDANGLQMVHKQLWKRADFDFSHTDNIASNFFPVQSAIVVKDNNKQVTILTDRSVAGSAGLRNGSNIELMQSRRLSVHDNYGLTDPLDYKERVRGKYFMQIT